MTLQIVQDATADEVLSTQPFALLCGMLLQEQVPLDVAFAGPARIFERFGSLEPSKIAQAPADQFAELCAAPPPIHPYPESMAVLIQAVAKVVVTKYDGETAQVWQGAESGEQLMARLQLLPGFSKRKAQMLVALLGKQLGVQPNGWQASAGVFAEPDVFKSAADVHDAASLERVLTGRTSRRSAHVEQGDDSTKAGSRPAKAKGSRKQRNVITEENTSDIAEPADEPAADGAQDAPGGQGGQGGQGKGGRGGNKKGQKKAAKRAAKRAANKERRRAEEAADPELAAQRAAKRAARQEAKMASGKGGGRGGQRSGATDTGDAADATADEASATDVTAPPAE